MEDWIKQRVAFALKCKPSEVPDEPLELEKAMKERRAKIKKAKDVKGVPDG